MNSEPRIISKNFFCKTLDFFFQLCYYISHGVLAQLEARHTGSVEVTGSSPVCSIFHLFRHTDLSGTSRSKSLFLKFLSQALGFHIRGNRLHKSCPRPRLLHTKSSMLLPLALNTALSDFVKYIYLSPPSVVI